VLSACWYASGLLLQLLLLLLLLMIMMTMMMQGKAADGARVSITAVVDGRCR